MSRYKILTDDEIRNALAEFDEWKVKDNKLHAVFTFSDFAQAMDFMNKVALDAEALDHHPDWSNSYNKVSVSLTTHAAGDKITDLDVQLAQAMSKTAESI